MSVRRGGDNVGGFLRRFGTFTVHNGILSVTINIIVNNTFATVIATLIRSVVGPLVNLFFGTSFSSIIVNLNNSDVGVNRFIGSVVGFLVITFMLFIIVGFIGSLRGGPRRPTRPRRPAAGIYPCYRDRVSVGTIHYPRYASGLRNFPRVGT